MSLQLFEHLLESYGGFADRRNKFTGPNRPIRVDDRTETDRCHNFCSMFVELNDALDVVMRIDCLPFDDEVLERLDRFNAEVSELNDGSRVQFLLTPNSSKQLRRLATAVRRVVGRGRRYPERNWKWIAPRTSNSIIRLADALDGFKSPGSSLISQSGILP
jgi:hypothetical protein